MPLLTHLYRNHWNFERHILCFILFMHNEKLRKKGLYEGHDNSSDFDIRIDHEHALDRFIKH